MLPLTPFIRRQPSRLIGSELTNSYYSVVPWIARRPILKPTTNTERMLL
jgi:hypothetical protein